MLEYRIMRGYFGIKKRGKSHNKLMPILHTKTNCIFGFFEAEKKRVNLWILFMIKLKISIMTDKIRIIDNQKHFTVTKHFYDYIFRRIFRLTYSPWTQAHLMFFRSKIWKNSLWQKKVLSRFQSKTFNFNKLLVSTY